MKFLKKNIASRNFFLKFYFFFLLKLLEVIVDEPFAFYSFCNFVFALLF